MQNVSLALLALPIGIAFYYIYKISRVKESKCATCPLYADAGTCNNFGDLGYQAPEPNPVVVAPLAI